MYTTQSLNRVVFCIVLYLVIPVPLVHAGILTTAHNLAQGNPTSGQGIPPGAVCAYCHTPHIAGSDRALWSRALPPRTYNLYGSSTLEANLSQPTGTSRLCLSCHDGTTALAVANAPYSPSSGRFWAGTNENFLGVDLSDDHPISFVYDTQLALRQGQLELPSVLPKEIVLDDSQQLQCTSCHDPHVAQNPAFLRLDNRAGALCTACHVQKDWRGSPHATSSASVTALESGFGPKLHYSTVADNACGSCHKNHGALHPARLLNRVEEADVCLACHNGRVAKKDIERELVKFSAHRVSQSLASHDPNEDPKTMPRHVSCSDCHNPHQSTQIPASAPDIPGLMRGVSGVDISGGFVPEAVYEYEVCLKCHGDRDDTPGLGIVRQDDFKSIRLKIVPSNVSYHPIAAVGKNLSIGGFRPGYTASSMIYCGDCHNSDDGSEARSGPKGPHGSRNVPLLEKEYQTEHDSRESFQAFEMCYKCHDRGHLLRTQLGETFSHRKHLQGNTSCAVCHDAHGSRDNPGLINFMFKDITGATVVREVTVGGQLVPPKYVPAGARGGKCYLSCHGKDHRPL